MKPTELIGLYRKFVFFCGFEVLRVFITVIGTGILKKSSSGQKAQL